MVMPSSISTVRKRPEAPGRWAAFLLVAGALGRLLLQGENAWWRKAIGVGMLGVLVGLTAWQRLYLGVHWLTDIVGSVFVVGAWLGLVLPRPQLFAPSRRSLVLAACLLAAYAFFYCFPNLRVVLPSALSAIGEPVMAVTFGKNRDRTMLTGEWDKDFTDPPSTWMARGDAGVDVLLPKRREYLLMFAARPLLQSKAFACFPLEVSVNQQRTGVLFLYRGWREYMFVLDEQWVKPGVNTITFHVGAKFPEYRGDQSTVAFQYLRLFDAPVR